MNSRIVIAVLILYGFVVWALLYGQDAVNFNLSGAVKEEQHSPAKMTAVASFTGAPTAQNFYYEPIADIFARLCEEYEPWTPPPVLRGNSFIDRLEHNPE